MAWTGTVKVPLTLFATLLPSATLAQCMSIETVIRWCCRLLLAKHLLLLQRHPRHPCRMLIYYARRTPLQPSQSTAPKLPPSQALLHLRLPKRPLPLLQLLPSHREVREPGDAPPLDATILVGSLGVLLPEHAAGAELVKQDCLAYAATFVTGLTGWCPTCSVE